MGAVATLAVNFRANTADFERGSKRVQQELRQSQKTLGGFQAGTSKLAWAMMGAENSTGLFKKALKGLPEEFQKAAQMGGMLLVTLLDLIPAAKELGAAMANIARHKITIGGAGGAAGSVAGGAAGGAVTGVGGKAVMGGLGGMGGLLATGTLIGGVMAMGGLIAYHEHQKSEIRRREEEAAQQKHFAEVRAYWMGVANEQAARQAELEQKAAEELAKRNAEIEAANAKYVSTYRERAKLEAWAEFEKTATADQKRLQEISTKAKELYPESPELQEVYRTTEWGKVGWQREQTMMADIQARNRERLAARRSEMEGSAGRIREALKTPMESFVEEMKGAMGLVNAGLLNRKEFARYGRSLIEGMPVANKPGYAEFNSAYMDIRSLQAPQQQTNLQREANDKLEQMLRELRGINAAMNN